MAERIKHGTLAAYTTGKCRCDWCRMANRAYHGADMARRSGRHLRVVGPSVLTEQVTVPVSADDLERWSEEADKAGLSRQAYIRRSVNERVALDRSLERQREHELARPLLDHGG
jgi:hypothetical protein